MTNRQKQKALSISIILIILIFFLLSYNPYENEPDIIGYEQKKPIQLAIKSNESKLTYKTNKAHIKLEYKSEKNNIIYIKSGFNVFNINIYTGTNITYASRQILDNTYVFIENKKGEIFYIPSQTKLNGNNLLNYKITSLNKKYTKNKNIENMIYKLKNEYFNNKKLYLINQIGGKIMIHPVINKIISKTLYIGNKYRPKRYANNLKNYKEFQNILGTLNISGSIYKYNTKDEFKQTVSNQIQQGIKETNTLKWINKLF